MKNRKVKKDRVLNDRGSAIIMALIIMTVLVLMGVAVAALSSGTLNTNVADASNNDAYYAAEAGVHSAIEQVKYEASKYYNVMSDAQGSDYTTLLNGFHANINANADGNFVEPEFSDGVTTHTTFSVGEYTDDICEFNISCTATTADNASYIVNGSVLVKKVDIQGTSGSSIQWFDNTKDAAIQAGGTLDLGTKDRLAVYDGDVIVGDLNASNPSNQIKYYGGATLIEDANTVNTINDVLEYLSYSDPELDDVNLIITTDDYVINNCNVPPEPVSILGMTDMDVTISANTTVPDGIIHVKGDLVIEKDCKIYADIYVDGDIYADGSLFNDCELYGDIFVRGNFDGDYTYMFGGLTCDGFVDLFFGFANKPIYSGVGMDIDLAIARNLMFSAGEITIDGAIILNELIYSKEKVNLTVCFIDALVFSGGDIEFKYYLGVKGALIAKNNIRIQRSYFPYSIFWSYVKYSRSTLETIFDDLEAESGGEVDSSVFVGQSVTAEGRVN